MKKIYLIILVILMFFTNFVFAEFRIKGGLDLSGIHKATYPSGLIRSSDKVKIGFCGAYELIPYLSDKRNYSFGFGSEYQISRGLEMFRGDFNFITFYCFLNISFPGKKQNEIIPFLVGKVGYNLFLCDDDYKDKFFVFGAMPSGGIYYGGGFGIMFGKSLFIEGIYSVNNGKTKHLITDETLLSVKYSKLTIYLGMNFKT